MYIFGTKCVCMCIHMHAHLHTHLYLGKMEGKKEKWKDQHNCLWLWILLKSTSWRVLQHRNFLQHLWYVGRLIHSTAINSSSLTLMVITEVHDFCVCHQPLERNWIASRPCMCVFKMEDVDSFVWLIFSLSIPLIKKKSLAGKLPYICQRNFQRCKLPLYPIAACLVSRCQPGSIKRSFPSALPPHLTLQMLPCSCYLHKKSVNCTHTINVIFHLALRVSKYQSLSLSSVKVHKLKQRAGPVQMLCGSSHEAFSMHAVDWRKYQLSQEARHTIVSGISACAT